MVRMRQGGRESEVDADALRTRIATGATAEDATVLADDGRWHPARQWFLETFVVRAPTSDTDSDYVAQHRVQALTMGGLAAMLGVTGDSVHGVNTRAQNAVRDVLDAIDTEICYRPIVATHHLDVHGDPVGDADLADEDGKIGVPDWGRPYLLPTDRPIEIPAWQDPATGGTSLPDFAPVAWIQAPRRRRKRGIAPPPGSADSQVARASDQAPRAARPGSGEQPASPTDVIGAIQDIANLKAKRKAERKAAREAQEAAARQAAEASQDRGDSSGQQIRERARQQGGSAVVGGEFTPAAVQADGQGPTEVASSPEAAAAAHEIQRNGCLGCFGRLVIVLLVAFGAWVMVDVALQRFVESELAASWKATADDVPVRRPRTAVDGLIEIGPRDSLLPIVVAFDPNDARGVSDVARLLRWQAEHGVELGFPSGREPRVVLLPMSGTDGSELVRRLLVLHGKGELVDAWPELVAGDAGIDPAMVVAHAAKVDIDEAGLTILAQATAARELERTVATIGRVFGLAPPFAVAILGQALPSDVATDPARLTKALEEAAASALIAARSEGPAVWETLLREVPEAQATRWLRWIVRGERVASAEPEVARAEATPNPSGPQRLDLPQATQRRGKPGGVQLVFVADLQCPHSRTMARRLDHLLDEGADVDLAFVHRPIVSLHPDAERAARLAQAAVAQGAFWPAVDWIFVHGRTLDRARMVRSLARKGVHLDGNALDAAALADDIGEIVAAHIAWADAHGVTGTPTLFVDGRPLRGAVTPKALTEALVQAVAARAVWTQAHPGEDLPLEPATPATQTTP